MRVVDLCTIMLGDVLGSTEIPAFRANFAPDVGELTATVGAPRHRR